MLENQRIYSMGISLLLIGVHFTPSRVYFITISRVKQSQLPIYKAIYRVYFTPSITFLFFKAHLDSLDSSGSHRGAVQTRWKFHWHQALIEILAKAKALPKKKTQIWQIDLMWKQFVHVLALCLKDLFYSIYRVLKPRQHLSESYRVSSTPV